MNDHAPSQAVFDHFEIQNIITKGLIARNSGLWQELGSCYHPDAHLTTSWFNGKAADFVSGSAEMKIARHDGESQKHMTSNHLIRVSGSRAVAECDLILYQRRHINGVELDFTTWSRRLHLLEKRNGEWRISRQTVIYEKDRMEPAYPDRVPADFYSSLDLSKYPAQIRYHCWRNDTAGFPPPHNICLQGTPRETEVRENARLWLAGA